MYLIYKRGNVCDIIQMLQGKRKKGKRKKGDERNDSGRNH